MTDYKRLPEPPFTAPKTTTSPHVQEVLNILQEAIDTEGPQVKGRGPSPTTLRVVLDEVLRLQERESELRGTLLETFRLSLLVTHQRDQAALGLTAVEKALERAGAHFDAAQEMLEEEDPDLDAVRRELRYGATSLEPTSLEPPTGPEVRRFLQDLASRMASDPGHGGLDQAVPAPTGRHHEATATAVDDPPGRTITDADMAKLRRFWNKVRPKAPPSADRFGDIMRAQRGTTPASDDDNERG